MMPNSMDPARQGTLFRCIYLFFRFISFDWRRNYFLVNISFVTKHERKIPFVLVLNELD